MAGEPALVRYCCRAGACDDKQVRTWRPQPSSQLSLPQAPTPQRAEDLRPELGASGVLVSKPSSQVWGAGDREPRTEHHGIVLTGCGGVRVGSTSIQHASKHPHYIYVHTATHMHPHTHKGRDGLGLGRHCLLLLTLDGSLALSVPSLYWHILPTSRGWY